MMKACLFDLDGTLLPMDTEGFVKIYLKSLAPHVAQLIPPDKLISFLWKATEAMIQNEEAELTNEQVFEREFLALAQMKKEEIWPFFDRFYAEEYPKLKVHTGYDPTAREVVLAALKKGYKVAIATNPVFPEVATMERLRWAGVDDLPLSVVTVHENTHFCKPNPRYYLEVAELMGVKPEECVMIGNDMQEDMVAGTIGMKTYYVKAHAIDRGEPVYPVDGEGMLADLLADIREEKGVFMK